MNLEKVHGLEKKYEFENCSGVKILEISWILKKFTSLKNVHKFEK